MKERPIIFSSPMVRAILDGRKTQTRRAVMPQPPAIAGLYAVGTRWYMPPGEPADIPWPRFAYGLPGDRLWVRETYVMAERIMSLVATPCYKADEGITEANQLPGGSWPWKWTPAIHMRREHCRLVLEVTAVRVERLQEISAEDAQAEGIDEDDFAPPPEPEGYTFDYRAGYRQLWDSLNAKRGFGWETNPFVWIVEFKRAQ